jgi:hypothetical protein
MRNDKKNPSAVRRSVLALAVAAACGADPAWSQDDASARSDKDEGAAQLDVVTVVDACVGPVPVYVDMRDQGRSAQRSVCFRACLMKLASNVLKVS